MKNVFKNILVWFRNVFNREHDESEVEEHTTYNWSEIVEVMKLYSIPEQDIVIGKQIYKVTYLDGKKQKKLTIEYPVTWDNEKGKCVFHKDIEHNIKLDKKKIIDIESDEYGAFTFINKGFNRQWLLDEIISLNSCC